MCRVLEIEAVESLGKECGVAFSTVVQDGDSTNLSNIYLAGIFQNMCLPLPDLCSTNLVF